MRARELQLKGRRGRMLVSGLAIVAVAAAAAGILATRSNPRPAVSVQGHATTTAPASTTTSSTIKPGIVATTTTTKPGSASPSALSASFVSASRGWVVEQNGRVDVTNDGGAHWSAVSRLPSHSPQTKIRFADASVGFGTGFDPFNASRLYATSDAGATWTRLQTPFSTVYDLAISRGVVYAVSFDQTATKFRIWSTPADHLAWVEDPLVIPVGAGPVPSIQLVFSNGAGWLVEVDRTVVAGARMSPTGHWSAWTPPCSSVNGPAYLAASSATDLIASCDEGVWGPPARASAAYTSHDAGATFQRHTAPVFGAIAAAGPNYAVIFGTQTSSADSTDGGTTWHLKLGARDDVSGASDLGFTTATQGFVIFDDGRMLMTYDGGATWSAVTLP